MHNYCGIDWTAANSACSTPCPDGESTSCGEGESCFADVTSCPGMVVGISQESPSGTVGVGTTGVGTVALTGTSGTAAALPLTAAAAIAEPSTSSCVSSVLIGYYQSWSRYRTCSPTPPSSLPLTGLTHLIYSFAGINGGKLGPYNGVPDEVGAYKEFNDLKLKQVGMKTLIAVGGWTFDQKIFGEVSSTPESRTLFADSAVEFMTTHNFDGLDIDWEYPVTRDGTAADYDNLVLLAEALREAFGTNYLLTMAIPCNIDKLEQGYDLSNLSKHVDWFHVMSYDIYGAWDDVAGSNTDMPYIRSAVDYLLQYVPSERLVLGMASYGRSMALVNSAVCNSAGCPINGAAMTGCSGELGFLPYFELKE